MFRRSPRGWIRLSFLKAAMQCQQFGAAVATDEHACADADLMAAIVLAFPKIKVRCRS